MIRAVGMTRNKSFCDIVEDGRTAHSVHGGTSIYGYGSSVKFVCSNSTLFGLGELLFQLFVLEFEFATYSAILPAFIFEKSFIGCAVLFYVVRLNYYDTLFPRNRSRKCN